MRSKKDIERMGGGKGGRPERGVKNGVPNTNPGVSLSEFLREGTAARGAGGGNRRGSKEREDSRREKRDSA